MAATIPPKSLLDKAAEAVARFGKSATAKLAGGGQPEDQLRAPFERLFEDMAEALGVSLVMIGETSLASLSVRPDYAADVAGARVGYVELKAPGRGVPTVWTPNKHEKTQWEKLRLLPNVLYTDGIQWAVFRDGELVGQIARLNDDVRTAGSKLIPLDGEFTRVVSDFLLWKPNPPRNIRQLVRAVAGLCKLLRTEVIETIDRERRGEEKQKVFTDLSKDWRKLLFPGLTHEEFADAYAQTVTFALLLARVDGIAFEGRTLGQIAAQLGKNHSLMGKALAVLTHDAVEGRSVVVETLKRVIGAVDWDRISDGSADSYLHLYERFLEAYDSDLRKQSGSYYTPNEVVSFMVRFVDDILRTRFGREGGYASDDVVVVDPAMGTGTYLLNIVNSVAQTVAEEEGKGAVPGQLKKLFGRLVGLERQAGPYAVAELRLNQALKTEHGAEIAEKDQKLYVADTLDNPFENTQLDLGSMYEPIVRSRREANKVKRETPVQVVIGNPPYRERAKGMGGWIEQGAGKNSLHGTPLRDFKAEGLGKYEYVLSNLYVYFWRWATWKVFDAHADQPTGIVAFITTSGYTTGPGFAGMREYLRRTADEGWIIDVSPEGHQPEVNTRVFPGVQQPLCIGIFARYAERDREAPARIHHLSLSGRRTEKFTQLAEVTLDGTAWTDCSTGWQDRLQPAGGDSWLGYPLLGDLMPWQSPGVQADRTWVYAPDRNTLGARWERLLKAASAEKADLFKETSDRTLTSLPEALSGRQAPALCLEDESGLNPNIELTSFRSFDRQWLIADPRVIGRPRPALWQVFGETQIFITEQHAHPIESGPALTFGAYVPNKHHFNGRGGRVLPLYRDRAAGSANLAPGLLRLLTERLGQTVTAADVLAYIAAVTAHGGYTERFREDLRAPSVRVPVSADPELWERAVSLGKRVLWLHTYGERFADPAAGRPAGAPRPSPDHRAKVQVAIPGTADEMPDDISYDAETATLRVGAGRISPVLPEVWAYEVSGMKVVKKWFGYRKKNPAGRKSSPLDDINTEEWPAEFTTELLHLLHVLTLCVELEPDQADLLERICTAPLITVADLEEAKVFPVPVGARKAPAAESSEAPTLL